MKGIVLASHALPDTLTWLQLGLSAALAALIIERVRYLLWLAPLSPEGLKFVVKAIEQGRPEQAKAWAEAAPRTHVGQLLRVGLLVREAGEDDDLTDLLFELQARCLARLRVLRVGATVASTLGLLTGILRIRGGLGDSAGLLALEAGLAEKVALSEALFAMALGVATSAVCFYALGILREGAKGLLAQGTRVAGVLGGTWT